MAEASAASAAAPVAPPAAPAAPAELSVEEFAFAVADRSEFCGFLEALAQGGKV